MLFVNGTKENNTHSYAKKRGKLRKKSENTILDDCFIYLKPWQNISHICTFELVSIFPSYLRIMYVEACIYFLLLPWKSNRNVAVHCVHTRISGNDHNNLFFWFWFFFTWCILHRELALNYYAHWSNRIQYIFWFCHFNPVFHFSQPTSYTFFYIWMGLCWNINDITLLSYRSYFTPFEMYILIKIVAFICYHVAVNRNLVTKYIKIWEKKNIFKYSIEFWCFSSFRLWFSYYFLTSNVAHTLLEFLHTPDNRPVHWNHCWQECVQNRTL